MSFFQQINITPGVTTNVQIQSPNNASYLKVSNGTPFDLSVNGFGHKGSMLIPAGTEYLLDGSVENLGRLTILPINTYNISGTSVVGMTTFYQDERMPSGTWPITIPTQTVKANVSTVQVLQNDGSTLGTQFLETTPAGQSLSANSWTVDGVALFKIVIGGVYHQWLKTQTAGSVLQLGQAGDITEILGSLMVDQLLNVSTSASNTITINGSTSGTATLWQDCTGIIKRTLIFWNNFRNGGASNQDIALPQAYVNGAFLRTGELANFQLLSAGVAQTISTIVALAANGGTNSDATSMSAYGIGTIKTAFDTIRFPSGQANPHTGFISIEGH